jgi:hypothetical protein
MNKKPLLQVDSSKASGIHKLYDDTTDTTTTVYKYLATADVEIRNFRKIRFSPVKIKVIRRIAIHLAIRDSYNAFLFGR